MLLVAYTIRLSHPGPKLLVDVRFADQSERVEVVSRRKRLDATKPRRFEATGENHVTVEPPATRRDLRE